MAFNCEGVRREGASHLTSHALAVESPSHLSRPWWLTTTERASLSFGMRIEILTIGDELLLGFTIDTNAAHLGRQLAAVGIEVDAAWDRGR